MTGTDPQQSRLGDVRDRKFSFEDARVLQRGQITIPHNNRETHDLEEGDYVDVELYYDDEIIRFDDAKIGNSGRVTIPNNSRERHDIEPGDRVDATVFLD